MGNMEPVCVVSADNENHTKEDVAKPSPVPAASQEQTWKSPPPAQRNHIPTFRKCWPFRFI